MFRSARQRLLFIASFAPIAFGCSPGEIEAIGSEEVERDSILVWTEAAPIPQARTEVSVTTDGTRIYLVGGFARTGGGSDPTAPVEMWVYDPATDGWTSPGRIPEGVNHAGFVHHAGKLYIVGGFRQNSFEPTASVRVYDIASDTWSDGPPLPSARGALTAVVLDGRIHAIGGNVAGPEAVHDHEGSGITSDNSVAIHEALDLSTGSWVRLAPMPTPRNHLGAAVLDGRIHVVGGRAEGDFELTAHEVYDPASDRWAPAAPVPTGRSGIAVVEAGGSLYMFGGEAFGPGGGTFDEAERYDPATAAWSSLPPMPTARHGLGAATVGDHIHVISGGPQPGFSFGTFHERLGPIQGATAAP